MNILILSWRGPDHPNAGGAEKVTLEHAKGWVKGGYKVTLFTSYFKGAEREDIIEGVKIKRSGKQFFDVQLRAVFWYFFGNHGKIDLVIDEFHGIPFFTPLYVRVKKLGFIHEVAGEVWKLNPWPKPFNLVPAILGTLLEPLVFKIFYRNIPFLTVSESTRDDLVSCGIPNKNITVIHDGVDLSQKSENIPPKEKKKTAIFLGAISRDKGIGDALLTFAEIQKKETGWQFWVVGQASPEMREFIQTETMKLGLKENLKYWGCVKDRKKFDLLARAHVLINPSIREGWGLVNIEASAVGTPVAGYNVSGLRDSIQNGITGILVEKGNFKKLSQESIRLLKDKNFYQALRENSINWGKKFNWPISIKRSKHLIDNL